jgi:hypothetical protein
MNKPLNIESCENDVESTEAPKAEGKKLTLERTVVRKMLTIKGSTLHAGRCRNFAP